MSLNLQVLPKGSLPVPSLGISLSATWPPLMGSLLDELSATGSMLASGLRYKRPFKERWRVIRLDLQKDADPGPAETLSSEISQERRTGLARKLMGLWCWNELQLFDATETNEGLKRYNSRELPILQLQKSIEG
jgi:hypothetical protein